MSHHHRRNQPAEILDSRGQPHASKWTSHPLKTGTMGRAAPCHRGPHWRHMKPFERPPDGEQVPLTMGQGRLLRKTVAAVNGELSKRSVGF